MLTDTETARELVSDLRNKLLYNCWGAPCLYMDWKEVSREIERRLGDDLSLVHIIALGACFGLDPQKESECIETLAAFCKSVALESQRIIGYKEGENDRRLRPGLGARR